MTIAVGLHLAKAVAMIVDSLDELTVRFARFGAIVLMLNVVGINPFPLLAGAGIVGFVVGFGAQPVINDVVSGLFILFENIFFGDYIEVAEARGTVEAIQLRTTRLRDPNGAQHIVRNASCATGSSPVSLISRRATPLPWLKSAWLMRAISTVSSRS